MTKKHFEAIAAIILHCSGGNAEYIAINLADYFAAENPRFDRERFMKACGL